MWTKAVRQHSEAATRSKVPPSCTAAELIAEATQQLTVRSSACLMPQLAVAQRAHSMSDVSASRGQQLTVFSGGAVEPSNFVDCCYAIVPA